MRGAEWCARYAELTLADTEVSWQYSPESFTGTELDYALEVCEAVLDVWQPTAPAPGRAEPARRPSRWRHATSTPTRSSG